MIVKTDEFSYGRFTGKHFRDDEIVQLKNNLDYAFFVSWEPLISDEISDQAEKQSACIEIEDSIENQIAKCNPTCRNEVRRSFTINEFKLEINSTPHEELFEFHKQCENERNWYPVPPDELKSSTVVCMRYKDELISGMTAYTEKDFLRIGRIFTRRKSNKYENLQQVVFSCASRRLVIEMTNIARTMGYSVLDLGGISLDDPTKAGITKFKLSFGSVIKDVFLARYYSPSYHNLIKYCEESNFDLT